MQWEPRVLVTQSQIERTEGMFTLRVGYVILSGRTPDQVVVSLT